MWAPLASMGVDRVYLTNAARVEKYYFDSKALEPDAVEDELLRGLEQSGDVYMPGVCVARRFPAAFDALGVTGEAPREGSAEWLVDPPPERTEPWSSFVGCSEPTPVLLMAHPGSRTSLRDALSGAGRAGWGYARGASWWRWDRREDGRNTRGNACSSAGFERWRSEIEPSRRTSRASHSSPP